MAAKTRTPLWSIIYAALAIAAVFVVIQLLGVVGFSTAVINIIYFVAIFMLIATVLHLVRLI